MKNNKIKMTEGTYIVIGIVAVIVLGIVLLATGVFTGSSNKNGDETVVLETNEWMEGDSTGETIDGDLDVENQNTDAAQTDEQNGEQTGDDSTDQSVAGDGEQNTDTPEASENPSEQVTEIESIDTSDDAAEEQNKSIYYGDEQFLTQIQTDRENMYQIETKNKTYFVAKQGDDNAEGTQDHPLRTISQALSKMQSGDVLIIREGVYNEPIIVEASKSGKDSQYTTIMGMQGENVVISANGSTKKVLDIEGASFVRISGLQFATSYGHGACGIYIGNASHDIILTNNQIYDIKIDESRRDKHRANGIFINGDQTQNSIYNVFIYRNTIANNSVGQGNLITVTGNCSAINIVSNTIRDNVGCAINIRGNYGVCANASNDQVRDCLLYKNTIKNNNADYYTAYGIVMDGVRNANLSANTISKCGGGINITSEKKAEDTAYYTTNILLNSNKIIGSKNEAIRIGSEQTGAGWVFDVRVANSICSNNGLNYAILCMGKCDGVKLVDNQFQNKSSNGYLISSKLNEKYTKNVAWRNNIFFDEHSSENVKINWLGTTHKDFQKWLGIVGTSAARYEDTKASDVEE